MNGPLHELFVPERNPRSFYKRGRQVPSNGFENAQTESGKTEILRKVLLF